MKIDVMVTGPLLHYGIHPNLIYKMLEFAKATDGEVSLIEFNDGHPTKLLELTINDAMPPVRRMRSNINTARTGKDGRGGMMVTFLKKDRDTERIRITPKYLVHEEYAGEKFFTISRTSLPLKEEIADYYATHFGRSNTETLQILNLAKRGEGITWNKKSRWA